MKIEHNVLFCNHYGGYATPMSLGKEITLGNGNVYAVIGHLIFRHVKTEWSWYWDRIPRKNGKLNIRYKRGKHPLA